MSIKKLNYTDVSSTNKDVAKWFFTQHISERRPVVISGLPLDLKLDTAKDLEAAFGSDTELSYEDIQKTDFGGLNCEERKRCTVQKLCRKLEEGDGIYVTTQPLETDDDGRNVELSGEHIKKGHLLRQEVFEKTFNEKLMPTMVPYQYNCWLGNGIITSIMRSSSSASKTSGSSSSFTGNSSCSSNSSNSKTSKTPLHHDYHDNLYYVVRGSKEFVLVKPKEGVPDKKTFLKASENRRNNKKLVEQVVEQLLLRQIGRRSDFSSLDFVPTVGALRRLYEGESVYTHWNGVISYHRDFRDDGAINSEVQKWNRQKNRHAEEDSDDDILDQMLEDQFRPRKKRKNGSESDEESNTDWDPEALVRKIPMDSIMERGSAEAASKVISLLKQPDHFSVADSVELTGLKTVSVRLNAGDLFYLPASWFHEVYSSSQPGKSSSLVGDHFALNAWYHPPSKKNFKSPYRDAFWSDFYKNVQLKNLNTVDKKAETSKQRKRVQETKDNDVISDDEEEEEGGEEVAQDAMAELREEMAVYQRKLEDKVQRRRYRWWGVFASDRYRLERWKNHVRTFAG